jgi:lysophospholipase L1-like esterase
MRASESSLVYMPFVKPQTIIDAYARYNQVLREVAAQTGALLIDGENEIPGDPAHFTDSVHFTDAGSAEMARRVSKALIASPAVRELAAAAAR